MASGAVGYELAEKLALCREVTAAERVDEMLIAGESFGLSAA